MNLKGSKTEANLRTAFSGESEARNKYTYFAGQARKQGFVQIANILEETANNEKEHAKIWFKILHGDKMPDIKECLKLAAEGEHYEWAEMYKGFSETAKEEGFDRIAYLFSEVGKIERQHEERFNTLLANVVSNKVFARDNKVLWICTNCGHTHEDNKALEICPVCSHPQSYFEIKSFNY